MTTKTDVVGDAAIGSRGTGREGSTKASTDNDVTALRRRVTGVALASRAMVLTLAWVSCAILNPYDSSAQLRQGPAMARWLALGTNWDAEYFGFIASEGYKYEQMHAFFPLVPFLMRVGGAALREGLGHILGMHVARSSCQVIVGLCLGNLAFVLAALALFDLTIQVCSEKDARFAFRVATLFCFSPASVFMSAAYTESIFCLFSFVGMRWAMRADHIGANVDADLWRASVVFALATLTRSNGATLAGYLGYRLLWPFLTREKEFRPFAIFHAGVRVAGPILLAAVVPLGTVLGYAAQAFCYEQNGDAWTAKRPWCLERLPNVYSFVQDEYWNQGFLRFYRPEQTPNFVLAAPSLVWALQSARWGAQQQHSGFILLPFALHLGFLASFCLLCMHVQVATRFLAGSPLLYWYAADSDRAQQWIVPWACVYTLLGTALFACYYPFV